jgi:hypothetical protein
LVSSAAAADTLVQVDCPALGRERVAEIESRTRAALLLTEVGTGVHIRCGDDEALIEANAGRGSVSVRARTAPATLVDDVLAGVDQALGELRPPLPVRGAAAPAPASLRVSREVAAPESLSPVPRRSEALVEPAIGEHPRRERPLVAVAVAGALEAWTDRPAGGLAVAALRGRAPLWLGLSGAVFRPLHQDPRFDITELSLSATLTLSPAFARGISVTLEAGPSWLWTVPEPTLVERSHRLSAAFTGSAGLSWPIWRGRTGVMPTLGVRWFAPERGVRLDDIERFSLHGLSPRIALALVQRID